MIIRVTTHATPLLEPNYAWLVGQISAQTALLVSCLLYPMESCLPLSYPSIPSLTQFKLCVTTTATVVQEATALFLASVFVALAGLEVDATSVSHLVDAVSVQNALQ